MFSLTKISLPLIAVACLLSFPIQSANAQCVGCSANAVPQFSQVQPITSVPVGVIEYGQPTYAYAMPSAFPVMQRQVFGRPILRTRMGQRFLGAPVCGQPVYVQPAVMTQTMQIQPMPSNVYPQPMSTTLPMVSGQPVDTTSGALVAEPQASVLNQSVASEPEAEAELVSDGSEDAVADAIVEAPSRLVQQQPLMSSMSANVEKEYQPEGPSGGSGGSGSGGCNGPDSVVCLAADGNGNPILIKTENGLYYFKIACYTSTNGPMGVSCAQALMSGYATAPAVDNNGNSIPCNAYSAGATVQDGKCVCSSN